MTAVQRCSLSSLYQHRGMCADPSIPPPLLTRSATHCPAAHEPGRPLATTQAPGWGSQAPPGPHVSHCGWHCGLAGLLQPSGCGEGVGREGGRGRCRRRGCVAGQASCSKQRHNHACATHHALPGGAGARPLVHRAGPAGPHARRAAAVGAARLAARAGRPVGSVAPRGCAPPVDTLARQAARAASATQRRADTRLGLARLALRVAGRAAQQLGCSGGGCWLRRRKMPCEQRRKQELRRCAGSKPGHQKGGLVVVVAKTRQWQKRQDCSRRRRDGGVSGRRCRSPVIWHWGRRPLRAALRRCAAACLLYVLGGRVPGGAPAPLAALPKEPLAP
jgi:hypothetical protein